MNNTPTIKTCICLQYIGDNGPCPEHGDPPKGYVPPRMRSNEPKPEPLLQKAKRLLEFRRRTSRAPRLDDDLITQTRLRRLMKVIRPSRFARWFRKLTGK